MPQNEEDNKLLSDNELVSLIVHKRQTHLQRVVYDRYADKVYRKCISLCKERATAQDLTHDIMVKILTKLSQFKGSSDFSFWVHSITYNHCMDFLKKQKKYRMQKLPENEEVIPLVSDNTTLETKILQEMRLEQLSRLFEELNPSEKAVLLLRYQDGRSIKEIAEILSISNSAVKMRLKRTRDRLAEMFKLESSYHE